MVLKVLSILLAQHLENTILFEINVKKMVTLEKDVF